MRMVAATVRLVYNQERDCVIFPLKGVGNNRKNEKQITLVIVRAFPASIRSFITSMDAAIILSPSCCSSSCMDVCDNFSIFRGLLCA